VAKPARTLQRRGRGGDAEVGGTAWCRRQCAVPSWGRRVARARARASAGEDGREGASTSFIDEVRRFVRWKKISVGTVRDDPDLWQGGCRHICMAGYLIL
jgi:hypothetical protein